MKKYKIIECPYCSKKVYTVIKGGIKSLVELDKTTQTFDGTEATVYRFILHSCEITLEEVENDRT